MDPTAYDQSNLFNLGAVAAGVGANWSNAFVGGAYGLNAFGGTRAPDIIGVLKVDQAWGVFQLSAAAHNNHAAYYGAITETTGHPVDKWGWAVQAALQIKNIPTGAGDTLNIQAVYTDGATRSNFQSLAPQSFAMFGGSQLALASTRALPLLPLADGVFVAGTGIDTVKTWGMRGACNHNFDPYWSGAIYGAYAQLQYGDAGRGFICGGLRGLGAVPAQPGIINCNPDFNVAQIGGIIRWTPVKNLTFSADAPTPFLTRSLPDLLRLQPPSLLWPSRQLPTS